MSGGGCGGSSISVRALPRERARGARACVPAAGGLRMRAGVAHGWRLRHRRRAARVCARARRASEPPRARRRRERRRTWRPRRAQARARARARACASCAHGSRERRPPSQPKGHEAQNAAPHARHAARRASQQAPARHQAGRRATAARPSAATRARARHTRPSGDRRRCPCALPYGRPPLALAPSRQARLRPRDAAAPPHCASAPSERPRARAAPLPLHICCAHACNVCRCATCVSVRGALLTPFALPMPPAPAQCTGATTPTR
jgi:hypothetical protein